MQDVFKVYSMCRLDMNAHVIFSIYTEYKSVLTIIIILVNCVVYGLWYCHGALPPPPHASLPESCSALD
jgi:hypothetical protein